MATQQPLSGFLQRGETVSPLQSPQPMAGEIAAQVPTTLAGSQPIASGGVVEPSGIKSVSQPTAVYASPASPGSVVTNAQPRTVVQSRVQPVVMPSLGSPVGWTDVKAQLAQAFLSSGMGMPQTVVSPPQSSIGLRTFEQSSFQTQPATMRHLSSVEEVGFNWRQLSIGSPNTPLSSFGGGVSGLLNGSYSSSSRELVFPRMSTIIPTLLRSNVQANMAANFERLLFDPVIVLQKGQWLDHPAIAMTVAFVIPLDCYLVIIWRLIKRESWHEVTLRQDLGMPSSSATTVTAHGVTYPIPPVSHRMGIEATGLEYVVTTYWDYLEFGVTTIWVCEGNQTEGPEKIVSYLSRLDIGDVEWYDPMRQAAELTGGTGKRPYDPTGRSQKLIDAGVPVINKADLGPLAELLK